MLTARVLDPLPPLGASTAITRPASSSIRAARPPPGQRGLELGLELVLVEVIVHGAPQGPQHQLGVGRRSDGQHPRRLLPRQLLHQLQRREGPDRVVRQDEDEQVDRRPG